MVSCSIYHAMPHRSLQMGCAFLARQNLTETGLLLRELSNLDLLPYLEPVDPLVFGVVLAAIEKFRPRWWHRLMNLAPWLWPPGLALIVYALYLGEGDYLTVTAAIWQFPLVALGMAALLVCAVSPRLILRRVKIPGATFIASIAYSAYLVQKLVIHFVSQFCVTHNIVLTSAAALFRRRIMRLRRCHDSVLGGGTPLSPTPSPRCPAPFPKLIC